MCFVEPNLLSHTAHSISKKGVKKRDLNDEELKDILADLLPLIRTDHIIPYNSDVLNSAIKRGLISRPPSHMIGDEGFVVQSSSWIRGKNNGLFVRPRLFGPYYEDAKVGNVDCTCNLYQSQWQFYSYAVDLSSSWLIKHQFLWRFLSNVRVRNIKTIRIGRVIVLKFMWFKNPQKLMP